MNPLIFLNKAYNKLFKTNLKMSFSQSGEDAIILFLINSLKLNKVKYLDIGTNDPRDMNNTYLLYLNGYRGLCIEPDPSLHAKIKKYRQGDILIPAGISIENSDSSDFYIMDDSVLNTFSKSVADGLVKDYKRRILKTVNIPLISINKIFNQYCDPGDSLVVSLDVEGLDYIILQSIDWSVNRPAIICVETVAYSSNLTGKKDEQLIGLLISKNYKLYADTYINSIFLDNTLIDNPQ
jgi:FkbM family methyltransferase